MNLNFLHHVMLSMAQFQLPDQIQSNKNVVGIVVVYSRIFRLIFPFKNLSTQ